MSDRPTAVAYVRVSTTEQAREGISLDAQEARIRAYCTLHGLDLVHLERDEGVSGGKPLWSRPGGQRLVQLVDAGGARHVIACSLDRLSRDAVDAVQTIRGWDARGVALHLLDLGGQAVDTSTAFGRFFLTILAALAQMRRDDIAEKTAAALAHKKRSGIKLGAPPLGFRAGESGFEPDPEELEIVQLILSMRRRRGLSFRAIAAELAGRGIATKRGRAWHGQTVRNVWQNRNLYATVLPDAA